MARNEVFRPTGLTLPMVIVGALLGTLVCVSNMYFGLKIGSVSTMSASTALLSFAIFKAASPFLQVVFTPTENVVVQAMASSIASMPIAASLWSVIPAIEYLTDPKSSVNNRHFSILELIIWSLGVCLFGTVFSAPLREHFIVKTKLRFPGPFAVGVLVGALHGDRSVAERAAEDREPSPHVNSGHILTDDATEGVRATDSDGTRTPRSGSDEPSADYNWRSKILIIVKFSVATITYLLVASVFPIMDRIPIFGKSLASEWLWFLSLSPALLAFGVILDLSVAISMFLGAIIGWGVLSPIVKHHGWATGSTDSMENGVRGWLVWISVGLLLGDALMRVFLGVLRACLSAPRQWLIPKQPPTSLQQENDPQAEPLITSPGHYGSINLHPTTTRQTSPYISKRIITICFFASSLLCVVGTSVLYWKEIPVYAILLAVIITFPLCFIVIRAAGETDVVPSNHLSNACQLFFGSLLSRGSTASFMAKTMTLGGITEAGLWQSAVLMGDLKTGYMVQAAPNVMFRAQLFGSIMGTILGSCIYRIFTSVYRLPSDAFPMPMAYLWSKTARLASGEPLPTGVPTFTIAAMVLAAFLRLLSIAFGTTKWRVLAPSAVAISVAMLVPPSVTLSKLLGAALRLISLQYFGLTEVDLMSAATGCILTEGTLGFLPLLLAGDAA